MTLWNHKFTQRISTSLANRTANASKPSDRVRQLFQIVYQREPQSEEIREAAEVAKMAGWENLARALLNSNEFLYIE